MSVHWQFICWICSSAKGKRTTSMTLYNIVHICPCEKCCWHAGLLCRMLILLPYMPLPVGLVGWMVGWSRGLASWDLCSLQVGVHLRERLPVYRHSSKLCLQQNERSGLHKCERNREGLGCGRLRLPSAGWYLVSRSLPCMKEHVLITSVLIGQ